MKNARQLAEGIFLAGVADVRADQLAQSHLKVIEAELVSARKVFVVGAGKATAFMAQAVERSLGNRIAEGRVVIKRGHGCALERIKVTEAGHPTPDADGFRGAAEVLSLAGEVAEEDVLLCLWSGGASALLADDPPGAAPEEIMLLHRLLVRSGAGIAEINCVRKHLSQIKGGQLARAARRGRVMSLILSDVIGDAPDVIASGPTAPDTSTFSDALAVVERHGLGQQLPPALLQYLRDGAAGSHPETPKPGDAIFANVSNRVIGNNQMALEACQKKAMELGFESRIVTNTLSGDAGLATKRVLEEAHSGSSRSCLLFGGETTVKVAGDGLGGRCQHLALAAALELAQRPDITLLAAGTDGSDGPTDAAGAVVDCATLAEARKQGIEAADFLGRFDSYHFFEQTGGHIKTGPTRTNVMDIVIVLTAEKHA